MSREIQDRVLKHKRDIAERLRETLQREGLRGDWLADRLGYSQASSVSGALVLGAPPALAVLL